MHHLSGEEMAADALCEESRSVEAVLCPGQCFAGKT